MSSLQSFSIQPTAYAVSADEQVATLWHDPVARANTTGLPESTANAMISRELMHSVEEFEQYLKSAASPQHHAVMGERALTMAAAFASLAEEAIRKATRSDQPLDECWGCTNHMLQHNQRFHLFAKCPNKEHDPTVCERGMTKLREFLEGQNKLRRENGSCSPYGPVNAVGVQAIELSGIDAKEGTPITGGGLTGSDHLQQ